MLEVRHGDEDREDPTTQEVQVAPSLATVSNAEIGARRFVSPRTVEYDLHKVFTKLNISARPARPRAPREQSRALAV